MEYWCGVEPSVVAEEVADYVLGEIGESGYVKMVKRVWKHTGIELTANLIRKIYANDIRKKFNGKLTNELEACNKLDHNIGVHNTDYIIYFKDEGTGLIVP